jgi:PilZ domain
VDPYTYPDQSGLTPGVGDADDGGESVNYLRRLKGTAPEAGPAKTMDSKGSRISSAAIAATGAPVSAQAAAASPSFIERRKTPRLRCSGSLELRAEGADVRMWGTLTDVGLHGCYVEMNTTFPIGTKVDLVLKAMSIRVETPGLIRATYPFLGMGMSFSDTEPEQKLHLQQLLSALRSRSHFLTSDLAQHYEKKDPLTSADPKALVDEIALFFQKNTALPREEFYQIAKRIRRP